MDHPRLYKYHTDGTGPCRQDDCTFVHVALEWFRVQWEQQQHAPLEKVLPQAPVALTEAQLRFLETGVSSNA